MLERRNSYPIAPPNECPSLVGNVSIRLVFGGALDDTSSDLSATCRRHVSVAVVETLTTTTKPVTLCTNRSRTGQAKKQQLTEKTNDHDEPSHTILHRRLYFSAYTPPPLAIDGMTDSPDIVRRYGVGGLSGYAR